MGRQYQRTVIVDSLHELLHGTEGLWPLMHQAEQVLLYCLDVLLRQVVEVHLMLPAVRLG